MTLQILGDMHFGHTVRNNCDYHAFPQGISLETNIVSTKATWKEYRGNFPGVCLHLLLPCGPLPPLPPLSHSYFAMQALHSDFLSLSFHLFLSLFLFHMHITSLLVLTAFHKVLSLFIFFVVKMTLSQRKCRPWEEEYPCCSLVQMTRKNGMIYWKDQGIYCPKSLGFQSSISTY